MKYETHSYPDLLIYTVYFFAASNLARKYSEYFSEDVLYQEEGAASHLSLTCVWPLYSQGSEPRRSFLDSPGQLHRRFQLLYFTCAQLQALLFHFHAVA